MECSDREAQFKQFKAQCALLCKSACLELKEMMILNRQNEDCKGQSDVVVADRTASDGASGKPLDSALSKPQHQASSMLDLVSSSSEAVGLKPVMHEDNESPSLPIVSTNEDSESCADSHFNAPDVYEPLRSLTRKISDLYRTFPLLCSRDPKLFAGDGEKSNTEAQDSKTMMPDTGENAQGSSKKKKKKKKKKQKPPLPAWKRELLERRGMRKVESSDGSSSKDSSKNSCRRTIAIAFNINSGNIRWGLSGQLKNQRVHRDIWGKSLIRGRPRGTCAEFHVVNEALLAEEKTSDLVLYVADLMTAAVKARCRNCLYISRDAACLSDDFDFDGEVEKKSRFKYSIEKKPAR